MAKIESNSGDWFSYQAERTRPMPSHDKLNKMSQSDRVTEIAKPADDSIVVEESDASASMIQRIIGKFRGGT